ncbi:MAG: hypothetical protein LPK80_12250 [Bacteroidota bacterium]|nr:hypothetical protein [Bacteroidota bacterium]MDX5404262.1 hypothetical protein [Bacteroidota bacterium]MDX5427482.1 hypothetical protein [Bacteroidota bacterium]MDX5446764.1 hypothetical protein [Bacteroidota bacterium]MDX5505417.1 hypothetical protein [Bacteroidota bacterium]
MENPSNSIPFWKTLLKHGIPFASLLVLVDWLAPPPIGQETFSVHDATEKFLIIAIGFSLFLQVFIHVRRFSRSR